MIVGVVPRSLVNFRGDLISTLARLGHNVTACAPDAPHWVRDRLHALGAEYHPIAFARAGLTLGADAKSVVQLISLFRKVKPDIVLSYTIKPVIYASIAAWICRVPRIVSIVTGLGYAFSANGMRAKIVGLIARRLYKLALRSNSCVMFQNPDDLATFSSLGLVDGNGQGALINGSGVDLQEFPPTQLPDEPCFLMIARLLRDKGVCEYAEAAKAVRSRFPQARFLLVGGLDASPLSISERELAAIVEEGVVEYRGQLADVRPVIAEARIFVLPSYYPEGTPRTILEALSSGRPVITTDSPGCRETVVHGYNGYLVPVRDANSLGAAMVRMVEHHALTEMMGANSQQMAVEKYDVKKVTSSIVDFMGLGPRGIGMGSARP